MREKKFRAWIVEKERQVMAHPPRPPFMSKPFTFKDFDGEYFIPEGCYLDEMTIMDYIGLQDKNGKEIYEEDILDGGWIVGVGEGCFCINSGELVGDVASFSEVIGNIRENPELCAAPT